MTIPAGGAEGVITCAGAYSAGWSLYVKDGKPVFRYTCFDIADETIPATVALPEGKATVKAEFTPDGSKEGGGTLQLFVNDQPAGEGKLQADARSDTASSRSRSAAIRSRRSTRPTRTRAISRSPARSRRSISR